MPERETIYALNPEARIEELDTSLDGRMYQVVVGDRRFQVNECARRLLDQCIQFRTLAEIAPLFPRSLDNLRTDDDVRKFIEAYLIPCNIFVQKKIGQAENIAEMQKSSRKNDPLLFKIPLIQYRWAFSITSQLASLFNKSSVLWMLALIVLSHTVFFYQEHFIHTTKSYPLERSQWIIAVALVYLTLLFHELGHASACVRYQVKHGEIGFGIYWMWPVLYTDVTNCWTLHRRRRAVVDVGGIYFHLIASSVCCCYWIIDPSPLARLLVHSILVTVIINANPFMRFDGYWIVTDLIGIPSLQSAAADLSQFWVRKLFSQQRLESIKPPLVMSIPPLERTVVCVYAIGLMAFVLFMAQELAYAAPSIIGQSFPRAFSLLLLSLHEYKWNWAALKTCGASILFCVCCYRVWRRVYRICVDLYKQAQGGSRDA